MVRTNSRDCRMSHKAVAFAQFSRAAHDLRQPVQALKLLVKRLARQPDLSETSKDIARDIEAVGDHLDTLIAGFLDFARFEEGRVCVNVGPVSVQQLFSELSRVHGPLAEEKGLQVKMSAPQDLAVWADADLLGRALANLVGNAIKYTRKGRILVTARSHGGMVDLSVWDTGPGLPPAERNLVFWEFYRTGDAIEGAGFGLGLAIVVRIASLIGAGVSVRSRPWKSRLPEGRRIGCRFSLSVRAAVPIAVPRKTTTDQATVDLTGLRVVLVGLSTAGVADSLKNWGCEVFEYAEGLTALQATVDLRPADVIVIEQVLSASIGSADLIDAFRIRWSPTLPAIILTKQDADLVTRPATTTLTTPLDPDRLKLAMACCLSGARGQHWPQPSHEAEERPGDLWRSA